MSYIIYIYDISNLRVNELVFLTEAHCVLCVLRTQSTLSITGKVEAKFHNTEDVF